MQSAQMAHFRAINDPVFKAVFLKSIMQLQLLFVLMCSHFFQDFHFIFHMHHLIPSYVISEVCQGPSIPAFNQVPDSPLLTLMAVGLEPMLTLISIIIQVYYKALSSTSSKIHPHVSCHGNFSIQHTFVHD